MSTALFFITHEGIASNLLNIGESIIQQQNNNIGYTEVAMDADINTTISNIEDKLNKLNLTQGLLFITDLYGSTPSNISQQLAAKYNASLISGVNLPMIIRLLNYRDEPEQTLLQKALDGARKGVQIIS